MKKYKQILTALLITGMIAAMASGCTTKTMVVPNSNTSGDAESSAVSAASGASAASAGSGAKASTGATNGNSKKLSTQATSVLTKLPGGGKLDNSKHVDFKGATVKVGYWNQEMLGQGSDEASVRQKAVNENVEKTYNCKLQFINVQNGQLPALKTSILSGQPMVSMFASQGVSNFYDYYSSGSLLPLEDISTINIHDSSRYHIPSLTLFNGKHYGVTTNIYSWMSLAWSTMLLVNFTVTAKAGYTYNTLYGLQNSGQWTWDKFAEVATAVTKKGYTGLSDICPETGGGIGSYDFDSSFEMYAAMMYSNNTDWVKKDGNNFTFTGDNAAGMQVLNKYAEWANPNTGFIRFSEKTWQNFKSGTIAFLPTVFVTPIIKNNDVAGTNSTIGSMYFPKGPNSSSYVSPQYQQTFIVIPKGVKNLDGIGYVFTGMNTPLFSTAESQNLTNRSVAGTALVKDSVNTMMTIYKDPKTWNSVDSLYGVAAGLGYTKNDAKPGWYDYVQKVALGQMTANQAVSAFKGRANSVLSSTYS